MTRDTLRIALVQMTSADRHAPNIDAVAAAAAATGDADLLALPEVAGLMNANAKDAATQITSAEDDPFIEACKEIAARHNLWIQMGSTPVRGEAKWRNHGALIDANGAIVASYDKIHLFDVALEGKRPIGESKRFEAGDEGVVVDTPWGLLGLTICYDLRFPQLYRDYAQAGARVIFIPSAFTVPTGKAHWEVLLRARAIETGAWVVAAAQVGRHADGRETYGHAMIVDPWGRVVVDLGGTGPAQQTVTLDLTESGKARAQIPSLSHDRSYKLRRVVWGGRPLDEDEVVL